MPGLAVGSDNRPVTQAELSHLATRRPDDGHSGYKFVIGSTHGRKWRVRFRLRGTVYSLQKVYVSPREAAKAMVRYLRQEYGPDWRARIRPGWKSLSSSPTSDEVPTVLLYCPCGVKHPNPLTGFCGYCDARRSQG